MWLDFADMEVDGLRVRGSRNPFHIRQRPPVFDFGRPCSRDEIVVVEVHYHGKPDGGMLFGKNSYGRRVIFTDNWPDHAHHWFPSIDHPSDKATADITVTAPEKYSVVSNGRLVQNRIPAGWTQAHPMEGRQGHSHLLHCHRCRRIFDPAPAGNRAACRSTGMPIPRIPRRPPASSAGRPLPCPISPT